MTHLVMTTICFIEMKDFEVQTAPEKSEAVQYMFIPHSFKRGLYTYRQLRYHIRNHIDYVLLYSFGFQHI